MTAGTKETSAKVTGVHCLRVDVYAQCFPDDLEIASSHAFFGCDREEVLSRYKLHLQCDGALQEALEERRIQERWMCDDCAALVERESSHG